MANILCENLNCKYNEGHFCIFDGTITLKVETIHTVNHGYVQALKCDTFTRFETDYIRFFEERGFG